MITEEVRNYEVSLWTLQDEFITVLKWADVEQKGRIQDPEMTLDIDGTMNFSFSIPMYFYVLEQGEPYSTDLTKQSKMVKIPNPIWYNTQNGNLMINMRKLKVIFNKGQNNEKIFEFVITKITETHQNDELTCEVESEGLSFTELGKIGYKYSLSSANYDLFIEEECKKTENLDKTINEVINLHPCNIDYWMKAIEIEKYPTNGAPINSRKWYYKVDMDWSSFELTGASARASDKIYEEPYTSSWTIADGSIIPATTEKAREKARTVDISESNIYNITQTLAEKFGVYCRYEYRYNNNYQIIGRIIIFYNNFSRETDMVSITYPYHAKEITREMDSTDLTTKLYVRLIEDSSVYRGTISIMDTSANPTGEDYLLNFDYLKSINAISEDQYESIKTYEAQMKSLNNEIVTLQQQYNTISAIIPELEAKRTVLTNSITLADEQITANNALKENLAKKYNVNDNAPSLTIDITQAHPHEAYLLDVSGRDGIKKIKLGDAYQGVKTNTIAVYAVYNSFNASCARKYTINEIVKTEDGDIEVYLGTLASSTATGVVNNTVTTYAWSDEANKQPSDKEWQDANSIEPAINASAYKNDAVAKAPFLWTKTVTTYDNGYSKVTLNQTWKGNHKDQQSNITYIKSSEQLFYYTEGTKSDVTAFDSNTNLSTNVDDTEIWMSVPPTYQPQHTCYTTNKRTEVIYDINTQRETNATVTNTLISANNSYANKSQVYVTFSYDPLLYYNEIIQSWVNKKNSDSEALTKLKNQLGEDNKRYISGKTGLYNTLYKLQDDINAKVEIKDKKIKAFERRMGPALREGYWDAEDYSDYGDFHTKTFSTITYNANTTIADQTVASNDAIIQWDVADSDNFDNEDESYYESSINQTQIYYPCINLKTVLGKNNIADVLLELSRWIAICEDPNNADYVLEYWFQNCNITNIEGQNDTEYAFKIGNEDFYSVTCVTPLVVGSNAFLRFARYNNEIIPVLLLKDAASYGEDQLKYCMCNKNNVAYFGIFTILENANPHMYYRKYYSSTTYKPVTNSGAIWISNYQLIYPRIKIPSLDLKINSINVYLGNTLLEKYEDYNVQNRPDINASRNIYEIPNYINIKPEAFYENGTLTNIKINYSISNAATKIYLDAKDVLLENYRPKTSYTVSVNIMDLDFIRTLYNRLAQIIMINDTDLKFQNVFGYISNVKLLLDKPQEDSFEVKNYKTKFEDLFSTIVAQTDAMKKISGNIDASLGGDLGLSAEGVAQTLADINANNALSAYTQELIMNSSTVREWLSKLFKEAGEILTSGTKALTHGLALSAENADILLGFASRINDELTPNSIYSETQPIKYNKGDVWIEIDTNGNELARYIGMVDTETGEAMTRIYDGSLASIRGANLSIDAAAGIVDISGENKINIRGGDIYIAANKNVDIVGNKSVNIGGTTINIGSSILYDTNEPTTDLSGNPIDNCIGGINLVASNYKTINNSVNSSTLSKVLISPTKIEMGGSNIYMRGSNTIQMITSRGDLTSTNIVQISADDGILIGSGKGIQLFTGNASYTETNGKLVRTSNSLTGAAVELTNAHLFLGFLTAQGTLTSGSIIELNREQILLATGTSTISNLGNTNITNSALSGVQIKNNYIGLAAGSGSNRSIISLTPTAIRISNSSGTNNTEGSYIFMGNDTVNTTKVASFVVASTGIFKILTPTFYLNNSATGTNSMLTLAKRNNDNSLTTCLAFSQDDGLIVNGNITATTLIVGSGTNSLTYSVSNGLEVTGSITGSTITGGSINIGGTAGNRNFTVDTNGNVTAKGTLTIGANNLVYNTSSGLSVTGSITSNSLTVKQSDTILMQVNSGTATISGWNINSSSLYSNLSGATVNNYTFSRNVFHISNDEDEGDDTGDVTTSDDNTNIGGIVVQANSTANQNLTLRLGQASGDNGLLRCTNTTSNTTIFSINSDGSFEGDLLKVNKIIGQGADSYIEVDKIIANEIEVRDLKITHATDGKNTKGRGKIHFCSTDSSTGAPEDAICQLVYRKTSDKQHMIFLYSRKKSGTKNNKGPIVIAQGT